MNKKNVHVIPHTHWDREWYFTTSRSKVYLLKDLQDVIKKLEQDRDYDRFVLDGQASLIEEYLKWRPLDFNRVKQLVLDGKLIIGPWYTQTDQFVISGESIVRNLQTGINICRQFGDYMNVGYVPDSFGQESNMPQIYDQFGIKDTFLWRGVPDEKVSNTEFIWRGEDGTTTNVYRIPFGYFIGGTIDETKLDRVMYEEPFKTVVKKATTNNVAFPNGFDQAPPRENLPEVIQKLNDENDEFEFKLSSIQEYIDAVKEESPILEEFSGELTNGKNMRVHKTIYSSRSDLKKLNTELQFYLVNILEPLLALGDQFEIEYPKEAVTDIWKLMFENAAHDSIGSCVSDTTNEDIYMRYKQVRDISVSLVEITLRQISTRIKKDKLPISLTAFNTLPEKRTSVVKKTFYVPSKRFEIVDLEENKVEYAIDSIVDQTEYILDQTIQLNPGKEIYIPEKVYEVTAYIYVLDVSPIGYKQFFIKSTENEGSRLIETKDRSIDNNLFNIKVHDNGSLKIKDKKTGKVYDNQGVLEENGDGGDSFNYSPAKDDLVIHSTDQKNKINVQHSNIVDTINIKYNFALPKNLKERANKQLTTNMDVEVQISLEQNSKIIKFKIKVDNREIDDHRLCVLFDTGISSKVSIADEQFGTIQRPVYLEEEMKDWNENKVAWNERPISIETCQSFVSLADSNHSFSIFPKGVREYEIIGDSFSVIRLTLFRTYGMMGKEDLLYRPGRASGEKTIATPNAELHEILEFDFGLYINENKFDNANVANKAKSYNTDIQLYEYADFLNRRVIFNLNDVENKDLPMEYSMLNTQGNLTLSTLKKADMKSGYIARFYNSGLKNEIDDVIEFSDTPSRVYLVDLKEDITAELKLYNNKVFLKDIGHAKIVTIYFEY